MSWSDTNPFVYTSPSQSDMSAMVELEGEEDHVWPALTRKKKEESKLWAAEAYIHHKEALYIETHTFNIHLDFLT